MMLKNVVFRFVILITVVSSLIVPAMSAQENTTISKETIANITMDNRVESEHSDYGVDFSDATWTDSDQLIVTSVVEGFRQFDLSAIDKSTVIGDAAYTSLSLNPDNTQIAALSDLFDRGVLHLWDLPSATQLNQFMSGDANIAGLFRASFDANSNLIFYGSSGETRDTIVVWNVSIDSPPLSITFPYEGSNPLSTIVSNIALSPDGQSIAAVGGVDGLVHIWDAVSGEEQTLLERPTDANALSRLLSQLKYSQDERWIAASSANGWVFIWDLESGENALNIDLNGVGATGLYFNPGGDMIVTKDRNEVIFWNLETGDKLRNIEQKDVVDVAFSPNGHYVAIVSYLEITVWSVGF